MIGVIKDYDPETETGSISNGKEDFQFEISDWIANAPPEQGDHVKFDLRGVKPFNIDLYAATLDKGSAVKRKYLAIFLAFFFGILGVHRLYLGYYRMAVTQIIVNALLVFGAGLPGYAFLWGFVEAILIFGGHIDKDAQGRPLK
jgi:TM2 domain-containing membrane protein YozV